MATTMYLRNSELPTTMLGGGHLSVSGSAMGWYAYELGTSNTSSATFRSTGTTTGGPVTCDYYWLSEPLASAVTISGTINLTVQGYESSMSANAAVGVWIQKVSAADFALTTIAQGLDNAELGTASAAMTWSLTPTSTAMGKGDRLRVVVYFGSAPSVTMGNGYSVYVEFGDAAYLSTAVFTENLSFMTFSGAQYLYPTNTASDVSTADVDYRIWTSRGT